MKIKTLLVGTMVFFGLVLAIIAISLTVANRKVRLLNEQADIATRIEHGVGEITYLSNEYLINPREQLEIQWRESFGAMSKDLSRLEPEDPKQRAIAQHMRGDLRRLDGVFADVSRVIDAGEGDVAPGPATQVSWSRMAVQTQQLAFDARRITHIIRDEQAQIERENRQLIYFLLAAFSVFLAAGYYIGYRRLLGSLTELHEGTEVVGSGDLRYEIPVRRKDEIGELSLAFNRMASDLRGVTASKAELEEEIEERAAAERALYEERERLAITLRSIGDGVIATDTESKVVLLNGVAEELTGWSSAEAAGRPIADVFNIISEITREPAEIPVAKALETGMVQDLANHTALIAKDGTELSIADSCAPIRALDGSITGAVLVFRDVTGQHKAERLRDALNDINADLGSTLDVDSVMPTVIEKAARALDCEKAVVRKRTGEKLETHQVFGLGESEKEIDLAANQVKLLTIAGGSVQPAVLTGEELAEELSQTFIETIGVTSALHALIMMKGKVVGDLTFLNLSGPESYFEMQRDFAQKLAAALSLALENARLYEAERHIAQTLQEALISMPGELPGLEFSHLYRSATKSAKVGGDFYDIFQIQHGKVGIVIGDVAGKGISAATLTVLVQNTIKALAHQDYSPSEIMSRANDVVYRETPPAVFVTVFFCTLNTETGLLEYCCAGHPPAIVKRKAGASELLHTASPVLGAFDGLSFSCASTPMEAGDTLILYTDGVTEARRADGELFGEDRLVETVRESRDTSQMTPHIFEEILKFTGGKSSDDLAILSISLSAATHLR